MTSRFAFFGVSTWLLLVVTGCGGEEHAPGLKQTGGKGGTSGKGGSGGSGGTTVDGGTGATGGSAGSTPGGPEVKITSPKAAADPNAGEVVVGDKADVLCTATKAEADVDAASVKIAILDSTGTVIEELNGTGTLNPDEYTSNFVITAVPNGKVSFRCTAEDVSTPPKLGSDKIDTFVDHGPAVTIVTPAKDSAYPASGAVPFEFKVAPAPLATGDNEAAVDSVTLDINGVSIPPTKDPGDPNGYKLSVNFSDTTLFPKAPSGSLPVVIKAKNKRTPTAAERTESYFFTLDGSGPVVTIKSHKDQEIIGGKVTLGFNIVDALSLVDQKTISVKINDAESLYNSTDGLWTYSGNDYTFQFDSANQVGSKVQVTINVTAKDIAGNQAVGDSVVLFLDNYPPSIDLDAGNVRTRKKPSTSTYCSVSFDPLGSRATDDLEIIQSFAYFRSIVWDETNYVSGQLVQYYATVDPLSVLLFLQPDSGTVPLLINNDGDPECDAVNTKPAGVAIPFIDLNPITPAGAAYYGADDPAKVPAISGCIQTSEVVPQNLCTGQASDLSVIVRHDIAGVEPIVYGIGAMTGVECTGSGWEISSQLGGATQKEGWFCLAVAAKDKVGNASVSRPLRVCYDDPNTTAVPACKNSSTTPPTCTDGCTAPPAFAARVLAVH